MICVAAVVVLCWRMRYGTDFTDEAFYVALPFRFALGDRPFVDELNIAQTAGVLLYPFVKLYVLAVGDATGIFLFMRGLFVVLFALVGGSAYALARVWLPRAPALLIGAMCLFFLPYGIPGLSYNTLSMGLLAAGLFIAARALVRDAPPRRFWREPLYWVGFAHGGAVFSYGSLLLAALATAVALAVLATGRRLRAVVLYAAGGFTFAAAISPLLVRAGRVHLAEAVSYSVGAGSGFTLAAAWARLHELWVWHPELPRALVAVVAVMVVARWLPLVVAVVAVALPLFGCGSALLYNQASLGYLACFGLMGALLAVGLRDRRARRVLVLGVFVPAMVASGVVCLSSSNGVVAAGIGLYPAAIAGALVLAMFIAQTTATARWPAIHPYLVLAPAVALAVLASFQWSETAYYRDGPRSAMTERVTDGPYRGVYTTPSHAELLRELATDIAAYAEGPRALFIYNFPVAYLIANRRPMISSSWTFAMPARHAHDVRLFKKWARPGEMVILENPQYYPLERMIQDRSDIVAIRSQYTVYRLRGPAGAAPGGPR